MVQLQRNPPENGEGRCRVAERKSQHVCVHEELQLWEPGDAWGDGKHSPCPRAPGCSLGGLCLCSGMLSQQEEAGDAFCSGVVQRAGWDP